MSNPTLTPKVETIVSSSFRDDYGTDVEVLVVFESGSGNIGSDRGYVVLTRGKVMDKPSAVEEVYYNDRSGAKAKFSMIAGNLLLLIAG